MDVVAVPSVALQWRGWPHRTDSDGDGRSHRPNVTVQPYVVTGKAFEGSVDVKSAPHAKHTASRKKLASHAKRSQDVPVNFP
jgi:hypothetical protein